MFDEIAAIGVDQDSNISGRASKAVAKAATTPHPHLSPIRLFPGDGQPFRVIYGSGTQAYAYHPDGHLLSSTSSGIDWNRIYSPASTDPLPGYRDCFLPLPTTATTPSNIVALANAGTPSNPVIRPLYSTNSGTTWQQASTTPATFPTNAQPLGASSLIRDPNTGSLFYGEYYQPGQDNVAQINLYRSPDNGLTWVTFYSFPGLGSTATHKIRAINSLNYDPYTKQIFITTSGTLPGSGIYRINNQTVEPYLTNSQLPHNNAACVDLMFFPNSIVFGSSNTNIIYSSPRTSPASTTPLHETNAGSWWSWPSSPDYSSYTISTSNDPTQVAKDTSSHLYSISNEGKDIYELGAVSGAGEAFGPIALQSITPKTSPPTSRVWLNSRFYSQNISGLFSQTQSSTSLYLPNTQRNSGATPIERIQGTYTLAPQEIKTIGYVRVPRRRRDLVVFDIGVYKLSGNGLTNIRLQNATKNTTLPAASLNAWERAHDIGYQAPWWARFENLTAGDIIFIQLTNPSTTDPAEMSGFVSYRFERSRRFDFDWSVNGF